MPISRVRKKKQKTKTKNKPDRNSLFKKAITKQDERGLFPVRVLGYNVTDLFMNISPEFKNEFEGEVHGGLKDKIIYKINSERIRNVAELTPMQEIILYENFNQYLWSLCYSLLVLFDKGIHEPRLKNEFNGTFADTKMVREAWSLFKTGLSLTNEYKRTIFFELPNPELDSQREYVGKANGIYCSALSFILLHEFAHHYYGHYSYVPAPDESKSDEYLADEFAIAKMEHHFPANEGKTLKAGILFGALSLFFLNRKLNGGDSHPDLDDRLAVIIEKLNLSELDNLWGIASLGLNLWGNHFNHNLDIPRLGENYKTLFYITLKDLKRFK